MMSFFSTNRRLLIPLILIILTLAVYWRVKDYDYVNFDDRDALLTLLEYNREDVVNLRLLRRKLKVK